MSSKHQVPKDIFLKKRINLLGEMTAVLYCDKGEALETGI